MPLFTWIYTVLLLSHAQAHDFRMPDIFHVSAGHLAVLPCNPAGCHANVSWSREGQSLGGTAMVEAGHVWFRPAQVSHSGVYTCHYRSQSGQSQAEVELSVSTEECPFAVTQEPLHLGENKRIFCPLLHIYKDLNISINFRDVHWAKDCAPLTRPGHQVDSSGQLWLKNITPEDAGNYTCFIDVSVGGQNYSTAWSGHMEVTNETVFVAPYVVYPRDQVVPVHLGGSVELRCVADLGYNEDSHTLMYWLLNETHTDEYPDVSSGNMTTVPASPQHRGVQGVSTLTISKVHHGFLDISIICCVESSVGEDYGEVWLIQAEPSGLPSALAWSLSLCLALLLITALLYCCRVELVLAYRDLRSHFSKHYVHDGKLFDGVVSCLLPPGVTLPPEVGVFSLQLLPQHLEQQWGYRLYVAGRDDCPGESLHDALSETVRRSRRLLLLLCASKPQGAQSESEQLQPLCYEQRVGLHDALTHKEPRVVLIEIGGPVDYSRLPESVQYLRRTQGALRWRPSGSLSLLRQPERSFWNRLRYHMPPVPSGRASHMETKSSIQDMEKLS